MRLTIALRAEYSHLFEACETLPEHLSEVVALTRRVRAKRQRYACVADETGVSWPIIAAIHLLEAGFAWDRHLHNGDPLSATTVHVPRGRPKSSAPPFSWEESAIDALRLHKLDVWTDWSPPGTLYVLERYNGWGYRKYHPEVLSPYLWSWSNHYTRGKYSADGRFDPEARSKQCGAAVFLKALGAFDP